jgi:hypothetical protein
VEVAGLNATSLSGWTLAELAALFGDRPTAYAPDSSPLRRITGVGDA